MPNFGKNYHTMVNTALHRLSKHLRTLSVDIRNVKLTQECSQSQTLLLKHFKNIKMTTSPHASKSFSGKRTSKIYHHN